MVKELSLDYKKKKRLKIAITIFSFLTIALIALCIGIWSFNGGSLSPKDLVVEKVDIIKVPAQTVDGLPIKEDNSYLVHIKSKSLFTRLEYEGYDRTGNMYQKKGKVYVSLNVKRSLNIFKNWRINHAGFNMTIPSFANQGIVNGEPIAYNINKDIYFYDGDLETAKLIIPKDENQ